MSNDLGNKIRNLREHLGWAQSKLAKEAELSNDYISKLELGKAENPGINTIDSLANALNVSPYYLLKGIFSSNTSNTDKTLKELPDPLGGLNAHEKRIISKLQQLRGKKELKAVENIIDNLLGIFKK